MKLARTLFLTLTFGVLAALVGCRQSPEEPEADDLPSKPAQVRVATATVTTLRPSMNLIGTTMPIPECTSEISTQAAGQIASVSVVAGQAVRAGEVLVQLDSREAEARLASARAAEQGAAAVLAKLEQGPRLQEVEAARQTARQLAAVASSLRSKLDALRPLQENGEVSDVEFGQAQSRLEAAEAESMAAKAQFELLEAGTRPEEITEAKAALAAAHAEVTTAELSVEFCAITSPLDGVVTRLTARRGAFVSPADSLATVVDLSELFVRVRIPSNHFAKTRRGARADVWIESVRDAVFEGSVVRLSPQADPGSGDVEAFVSIKNINDTVRPGLASRVRIRLPELAGVLVIPAAAVADRDGTPVVTVLRDNKAYELPIQLGVSAEDQVQVIDGLEDGDLIATEGGYGLPDGCPVRIIIDGSED
ncbi:MAG: efflux RND transporter periplasmic adaptor subunit [Phycisphaerae bacterium]|nr:efflux RND transporter periplasmic adaptor subunit [Phycisphaerae bacterium]